MMAMRALVAIHKRVPDTIVCDNGKEFHSKAFDRFCDLNAITLDYRPAHQSRFGGVIERLFGTTNTEFIHNMVGNTKALRHVRTLTKSVDPINAEHLSFVTLHGLLDHYFFSEYNRERRHPAHDHTPEDYMHKRFMVTGRRLTRMRPYDMQFKLQTLVPVSNMGGTRVISSTNGIWIKPVWYWTDECSARRLHRRKVEVFVDMWDVSVAYAIIDGKWCMCVSRLLMQFRNLTSIELRYALYEVRLRLKAVPSESLESVIVGVLADHNLPAAAEATAATRQVYGAAGLTTVVERDAINPQIADENVEALSEECATTVFMTDGLKPQVDGENATRSFKFKYDTLPIRGPLS